MTLCLVPNPQAVRLRILVMNTRKPPSPMTQSQLTMTKAEIDPSTVRKTLEARVVDMD